ncbi:MAG: hypothetical protein GY937_21480 [bacterium]|nr:hypothetical protein [bacterium]
MLQNPALPFLAHYHVLSFPADQGQPSCEEADEIVLIATRKARDLGKRYYFDEECFSLIFNGKRTRRKPWLHIHILPTRNPAAKRLAFLAFSLNLNYARKLAEKLAFQCFSVPRGD